jgi:hypothetical protein
LREIPLTQGYVALVDDEDYERVTMVGAWQVLAHSNACYATRTSGHLGPTVYMHRMILCAQSGQLVDHINHDGLDNRKVNLRLCSPSQNMANQEKNRVGSSRFKGVHRVKGYERWRASVFYEGKTRHLGSFGSEEEAARAYDAAALALWGEYAKLNQSERGIEAVR